MRIEFPGGGGGGGTFVDTWYTAVQAGTAFFAGHRQGATAGQFSHVQLLNPAASGVVIRVYYAAGGLNAAGRYRVNAYDTALATLVRNGVNCLSSGAAGIGELRTVDNAAALGAIIAEIQTGVDNTTPCGGMWPFTLAAGEGILFTSPAANIGVAAQFWWLEA